MERAISVSDTARSTEILNLFACYVNEDLASSGINSEREGSPSRNGEMSSARISDVINEQFGEGGNTLLHVASRSSRKEIVLRLLECGADPAVK